MKHPITSKFGASEPFRNGKKHLGIDFRFKTGEELKAVDDGTIVRIVDFGNQNLGKGIFLKTSDGKTLIYGHLSEFAPSLEVGDRVVTGQLLGKAGNTGFSTGSHLHFAVKEGDKFVNPSMYIDKIQNMENLKVTIDEGTKLTFNISDILQSQGETFSKLAEMFKVNMINLIEYLQSSSIDYTVLIQHLKHVVEFFFT